MSAGVGAAVFRGVVRKVVVIRIVGVESELQHAHSGESGVAQQLLHAVEDVAEILSDDVDVAEVVLYRVEQLHAGTLFPGSVFGGLVTVGDSVVGVEGAEVVDTQHVEVLLRFADALEPPLVAGLVHFLPVVEGVPP